MKIVFTGGVYAGKSTILKHLRDLGYDVVSESATQTIRDLKDKLGAEEQKKWMMNNPVDFQTMNMENQVEKEKALGDGMFFLDRGLIDYIAFCEFRGGKISDKMKSLAKNHDYSKIFVFEVLDKFDVRKDSGRYMDEATSRKMVGITEEAYRRFGYETVRVPEMGERERVEYILDKVSDNKRD